MTPDCHYGVLLEGVPQKICDEFLHLVYRGKSEVTLHEAIDLGVVAENLKVEEIRATCYQAVLAGLNSLTASSESSVTSWSGLGLGHFPEFVKTKEAL